MTLWSIERLGRRGDGVALSDAGDRALAPLTLPGEVIEGQAEGGRITVPKIVEPSPHRVRAPCPHYRICGGCSLMHASDAFVAGWKRSVVETALAAHRIAAPFAPVETSPARARRRAVLSGRRTKKGALVGFHARASDVIVDIADCYVIRPEITAALPLLRRIVAAGASRTAELTLTVIHGPAGLDVTATGGKPIGDDPVLFATLAALAEADDLARLTWGDVSITRRPPALTFGIASVVPPPGAFLQATAEGEAALLAGVRASTAGGSRIADLFAGIGTFTLPLAEHATVHAIEGLAAPLAALDAGWRGAAGRLHRVTHEVRDLARNPLLPDEMAHLDAIVIDPPRAGAEAQARQIAVSHLSRLAFVACDPVNFARDARILADAGFQITALSVVDQFRWSPHVEIVAQMCRS